MAVKKTIKAKFQFRRDTSANWELHKDKVPADGEPCFEIDTGIFKIGDGKTPYGELRSINSDLVKAIAVLNGLVGDTKVVDQIVNAINDLDLINTYAAKIHTHEIAEVSGLFDAVAEAASNTAAQALDNAKAYVDAKIDDVNILVGDTAVSEQINKAISAIIPKCTNITLPAANWTGNANPYSQVVVVNGATTNSKIDLQPTALQIVELQNTDIALMVDNNDGVITVYALGGKPTVDYTMQALITEVVAV